MTIEAAQPSRVTDSGNGVTTQFAYPAVLINASDLTVNVMANGNVYDCTRNGSGPYDFTWAGAFDTASGEYPGGGTVTFNTAPPSGSSVVLDRVLPIQQTLELVSGGKLPAEQVTTAFDRACMIDQQLADGLSLCLARPATGGAFDAGDVAIANVGTPVLPADVATKAYVDNGGYTGSTVGVVFDGLFIDARGTGTSDDTAIWTQALADCASLGIPRIYARRPTYVKNLTISQPIEIIGTHGVFEFRLTATGGTHDAVVRVTSDYFKLVNAGIICPHYKGFDPLGIFGEPGLYCISFESGARVLQSRPLKSIWLENVYTVGGGGDAINIAGCDRLTVLNCECRYAAGHGLGIGSGLPVTKVRVDGFRAVACGGYGLSLGNMVPDTPYTFGNADIELTGIQLINCGKYAEITGFDGGAKFGCDLTTNSLTRLTADIVAHGCNSGGVECKFTLPPPANVLPALLSDIHLRVHVVQDCDTDAALWIGGESAIPANGFKRATVSGSVHFVGPRSYVAGQTYEVGDTIANGSDVYICWGNSAGEVDVAGNVGIPTGTGTGTSSYFDGTLYWGYWSDSAAIAANFSAIKINSVGSDESGLTLNNFAGTGCGYYCSLECDGSQNFSIKQLLLINPVAQQCLRGIFDGGNQGSADAAFITNIEIINPYIDVTIGPGIQLGRAAGSGTGSTTVTGRIVGGMVRSASGQALRLGGPGVTLDLSGGVEFVSGSNGACYVSDGGPHAIAVYGPAAFRNGTTGSYVYTVNSGAAVSWSNLGETLMLQPDATLAAFSLAGTTMTGQVSRGLTAGAPTCAGALGETLRANIATATVARYDCTTAGAAGTAVWTAKA